jgi:hypothetical protein
MTTAPVPLDPCSSCRRRQGGFALIWALVVVFLIGSLVLTGELTSSATDAGLRTEFAARGQAENVARAGLVDAFAWLRRQTVQPVTSFAPRRDLTASPPIDETDDARVGLVREFEITPGIWGRYEVRRGRPMDPFTDENGNGRHDEGEPFVDLLTPPDGSERLPADVLAADGSCSDGYGDGRWTPSLWTRDVSAERGESGAGTVWRIESRGLVYVRPRADLPLGQGPNRLIANATVATEVRRLTMAPPASAALCAPSSGVVTLGRRVRIRADQLGVGLGSTSGTMSIDPTTEITASTDYAAVPGYADKVTDIFRCDWSELKAMADIATRRRAGIPPRINDYNLVVLERDVTYDQVKPLQGNGVLAIRGNLTIQAGSTSFFSGLLYVDGNVDITGPAFFRGTIIATGTVKLEGSSGDYVEVQYDSSTVNRMLNQMAQYRVSRALYAPDRVLVDTAAVSEAAAVEVDTADTPTGDGTGDTSGSGGTSGSSSWWDGGWSGWGDGDEDYNWSWNDYWGSH